MVELVEDNLPTIFILDEFESFRNIDVLTSNGRKLLNSYNFEDIKKNWQDTP